MNEHEMLKEICDKIWHKPDYNNINVIEIIFTPEFMDKYKEYFYNFYKDKYNHIWLNLKWNDFKLGFFNYLDKPVEYLYNIIK